MQEPTSATSGRVAGKVALVTGAASGIGQATAMLLAQHGATLFCSDRDLAGVTRTAELIGSAASACQLDVTSESAWEQTMAAIAQHPGRLDILVNCAGISAASPVTETSLEEWHRVMRVNLDGAFLGTKHAIRLMRERGCRGSIIHVSSLSGIKPQPGASAYCTSKAALIMFSQTAALECLHNKDGIRVNTVSPGGVKTPMWKTMPFFQEMMKTEGGEEAAFAALQRGAPHGRFAEAEEIALAILYLASDESLCVNGSNLVMDGGS